VYEKTLLSGNLLHQFPGFFRASSTRNFVPLQVAEHFLELEKERFQDGLNAKFSANSNGYFPGPGMKDSRGILEFYYNFLQCTS
jgi:hypothetical protein